MATTKVNKEIYRKEEDGSMTLVSTETIEMEVKSQEEIIAEKEAELLSMYKELEALKSNS